MEVPVKVQPAETDSPAVASTATAQTPAEKPAVAAPAPVMDVRPPQAASTTPAEPPKAEEAAPEKAKDEKPEKATTPKKPRQPGIGMAITATVVIVFGLAAMAVYAYLKTQ
jgi:hypothetical protein